VGELILGLLHLLAAWSLIVYRAWLRALEDVFFAFRDVGEHPGVKVEVFG
jgi:hypothetical protein